MAPVDYIHIDAAILYRRDLPDKAKMLLGLTWSFNSKGITMSNSDLAKLLGCHAVQISRLIKILETKKLIRIEHGKGCNRHIYLNTDVKDKKTTLTSAQSNLNISRKSERLYKEELKVTKGDVTHKKFTPPTSQQVSTYAGEIGDFHRFWQSYPKKVSRPTAEKAFRKIKLTDGLLEKILLAVENQKQTAQWQKDSGQYIPNPATWLNGRRWEDELPHCETLSTSELDPDGDEANLLRKLGVA